jgi:hypothetical protein
VLAFNLNFSGFINKTLEEKNLNFVTVFENFKNKKIPQTIQMDKI